MPRRNVPSIKSIAAEAGVSVSTVSRVLNTPEKVDPQLRERVERLGYACTVDPAVAAQVAQAGYDPVYGARPLRRQLRQQVDDPLAEQLLAGVYRPGDTVAITVQEGRICCGRAPAVSHA